MSTSAKNSDVVETKDHVSLPVQVCEPWQRPTLRRLTAEGAETGVNSTTDANATFS